MSLTRAKFPITRKQFRAWLASKDPADSVGTAQSASDCPVANAMEQHGYSSPNVGRLAACFGPIKERKQANSPYWASKFIVEVDARVSRYADVTAEKALKILDGVTP